MSFSYENNKTLHYLFNDLFDNDIFKMIVTHVKAIIVHLFKNKISYNKV